MWRPTETIEASWWFTLKTFYWFDETTGVFIDRRTGKALGRITIDGYITTPFGNKSVVAMHRLVWLWKTCKWPSSTIDHRNSVSVDNRSRNLRDVPMRTHVPKRPALADKMDLRQRRRLNSMLWDGMRAEAENNYQRKILKKKNVRRDISATQQAFAFEFS